MTRRFLALLVLTLLLGALTAPGAGAYVYWGNTGTSDNADNTIGRANLDGSGANQKFVTGITLIQSVAIDGRYLYWASILGTGEIGRANLDGSGANLTFLGNGLLNQPPGVAARGGVVYWANSGGSLGSNALAPPPTGPYVIAKDMKMAGGLPVTNTAGLTVDGNHIYFANHNAIGRANLDGSGANPDFITGADQPSEVAVDGAHIYWANQSGPGQPGTIGRANLDGSGVNQNFISGKDASGQALTAQPSGVAVDGNYIYWSNTYTKWIGRAKLNGTGAKRDFIPTGPGVKGIAVDGLGPAGTTPPSSGGGSSTLKLKLGGETRQILRSRSDLRVTVACGVACSANVTSRLTINGKTLATWTSSFTVAADTTQGLRLTLPSARYNALRSALRAGKLARLSVKVTAADKAGSATATASRSWVVAIPGLTTVRAERAMASLVYANYGDSGPVVTCTSTSTSRWTCSFTAYTGGGQRCEGKNAGSVRRTGSRYRATINKSRVTCVEK